MTDDSVQIGGDEEIVYRDLSTLSLVALVVGLFAPLCFLAPLLWAVPILGVALSLAALGRIRASEGALVGRAAALIGLAVCVACLFTVASRSLVAKQIVSRQARQVALEWIAMLQDGRSASAYGLTVASTRPPPPGSEADEPVEPLDEFRGDPAVSFLMADGAKWRAQFSRGLGVDIAPTGIVYVQQQFRLEAPENEAADSARLVTVTLTRTRSSGRVPSRWLVADFELEAPR